MTDTTDLVARLRSYAKDQGGWHNIDDTCEEAANTIERITRERDEARQWVDDESRKLENMEARAHTAEAERDKANAAAEAHEAKWKSICKAERSDDGMCACSYDKPDDVCAFHSPKMAEAEARIAKMEAAIEKLREREVQARHAGLSRRDWHDTETAANQLRDRIDDALADRRRDAARAVAVGGE
jgi:chromosome segregation ATPase